ncbi:MAG: putative tricarboxylic transport rane protein [Alphaproteobacteria bacterium]|nr:putative tricarboxylic transport rane protein [Alphaproteobacteria bacterium]
MAWLAGWRGVVLTGLWMLCAGTPALAQYPSKPVRVIVPFAAGGTPDVVGRIISQQLAVQTGQSFVVENRPGADGVLGAQTVADAPPDGYTLLVTSSSFVVNPSFHKKLPFDVIRDFEPVSNIAATEAYILGVNPDLPARTVKDLVALARAPGNTISFASPGVGNGLHLAGELFKSLTGTQMVHVPYRGGAPAITGLIAGDVQLMFMTPPSSLPYVEAGKIRALAYTGAKRFTRLPDVPTMAEAGVPGMEVLASWAGMFAPAKTPAAVLARLQEEVQKAVATPAMRDRLTTIGVLPVGNAPAEFKPFIAEQVKLVADIVRAAGIEPQ